MRPHPLSLAVNELDQIDRALARTPPLRRSVAFSAVLDQLHRLDGLGPNACAAVCRRTLGRAPRRPQRRRAA
jgi:hypothetical protein